MKKLFLLLLAGLVMASCSENKEPDPRQYFQLNDGVKRDFLSSMVMFPADEIWFRLSPVADAGIIDETTAEYFYIKIKTDDLNKTFYFGSLPSSVETEPWWDFLYMSKDTGGTPLVECKGTSTDKGSADNNPKAGNMQITYDGDNQRYKISFNAYFGSDKDHLENIKGLCFIDIPKPN